jgi:hypothetical protein
MFYSYSFGAAVSLAALASAGLGKLTNSMLRSTAMILGNTLLLG